MVDLIVPDILKKKEDEEETKFIVPDILKKNNISTKTEKAVDDKKTGLITSAVAGVGSGAVKSVEGITTLGTTLIDLGLGTDLTKDVEDWFDSTKTFTKLEDLADGS